jgi:hypothetical protein
VVEMGDDRLARLNQARIKGETSKWNLKRKDTWLLRRGGVEDT